MHVIEIANDAWTDAHGERVYSARFLVVDALVIGTGDTAEQALADAKAECERAGIPQPATVEIWDQGE